MIKQRWTSLRLQAKWYSNSLNCIMLVETTHSPKLNSLLYFAWLLWPVKHVIHYWLITVIAVGFLTFFAHHYTNVCLLNSWWHMLTGTLNPTNSTHSWWHIRYLYYKMVLVSVRAKALDAECDAIQKLVCTHYNHFIMSKQWRTFSLSCQNIRQICLQTARMPAYPPSFRTNRDPRRTSLITFIPSSPPSRALQSSYLHNIYCNPYYYALSP